VVPTDSLRVLVPDALPGEAVRGEAVAVDARTARASRAERLSDSPARQIPPCDLAGRCGGCALQHWQDEGLAAWKQAQVVRALAAVGLPDAVVRPTVAAWGEGRRRAVLHARRVSGPEGVVLGFTETGSHRVANLLRAAPDPCAVLGAGLKRRLGVWRALAALVLTRRGAPACDLHLTDSDTGPDVDVRGVGGGRKALDADLRTELAAFASTNDIARLSLEGEAVALLRRPQIRCGGIAVDLPPAPFLQATAEAEVILGEAVVAGVGSARRVADLYCGLGPFALRLASRASVFAADLSAPAVGALRQAADRAASLGLKPIETAVRNLTSEPLSPLKLARFDAVVLDPPFAGAAAQARALAEPAVKSGGPRRLVYVSCNPRSFAVDVATLVAGGWQVEGVTPVDQFRWSTHIEVVAVLNR
jgi:23S rRNA (uracil1939-C5)-methyltransferase